MQPTNAAFASKEEEHKWIQDEAVDPAGIIRPQDYLAAFWIKSTSGKKEAQSGGIEVIMYLVGGGYITGMLYHIKLRIIRKLSLIHYNSRYQATPSKRVESSI